VLVWGSGLDDVWNDLPVQPVFLPFVHQMARYAGSVRDRPLWHTVGQALDPKELGADLGTGRGAGASPELVASAPSGARVVLSPTDTTRGRALALSEQGFYEVRRSDAPRTGAMAVAVNLDLAESDLGHIKPDEIVRAVSGGEGSSDAAVAAEELTPQERERRQTLWWYLLVGLVLLLAGESVLGNRLSTGRGQSRKMRPWAR
jgi:hypothetical protein